MIRSIALVGALLVFGCSTQDVASSATVPSTVGIPPSLRSCPVAPSAVLPPPKPRTFDSVVDWAGVVDKRRSETARALEVCRARLGKILEMVDQ